MGALRDRWLELEPQIPNNVTIDVSPEVLRALLNLHRECERLIKDERRYCASEVAEARWVLARTKPEITGEGARPSTPSDPVLTRDEVIEHLRAVDEEVGGEQTHAWLVERFNITDAELTRWMTVTLSRDALVLLKAMLAQVPTVGDWPFEAVRRRKLEDEIKQALAGARPEEDE